MALPRQIEPSRPAVCGLPASPRRLCCVLSLVCGLLVSCAASPPQPSFRPPPPSQAQTKTCGELRVRFTLSYGQDGTPTYTAAVRDSAGQPPATVSRVLFVFTPLPDLGKPTGTTTTLVAAPLGEGRYRSSGGVRLYADSWRVEVIVRQTEAAEVVCAFSVYLSSAAAATPERRLHRSVERFMVGTTG